MFQELEQIETIWTQTKDWEEHWADWKTGKFTELQTKEMEELSNNIYKKLHKMSRELKVRVAKYTVVIFSNICCNVNNIVLHHSRPLILTNVYFTA